MEPMNSRKNKLNSKISWHFKPMPNAIKIIIYLENVIYFKKA